MISTLIQALKTDTIDQVLLSTAPLTLKARIIHNRETLMKLLDRIKLVSYYGD